MKCSLVLSLTYSIAACTASILKDTNEGYKEGDKYFYFSGDDGILKLINAEDPVDKFFIEHHTKNHDGNTYWLLTRSNPTIPQVLVFDEIQTISSSNYKYYKPTVFLVHGWNGNGNNYMNKLLTEAFLLKDDVNIIIFDWSRLANKGYTTAKAGTAAVGVSLGQFIKWLIAKRWSTYNKIHLVGFSLGGHLVGNAGRETGGVVARITALDPAGPLWGSDHNRLNHTDAKYVEVIHTNTGVLGYAQPCGDADFYPNGGSSMPGCWISPCSHSRAFEYMASSVINNHFMANLCSDHTEASRDRCTGPLNPMGNNDFNKRGCLPEITNTLSNAPTAKYRNDRKSFVDQYVTTLHGPALSNQNPRKPDQRLFNILSGHNYCK